MCLTWYLIHEELYWWYLNFKDAGSYPDGRARAEGFETFTQAWKEATSKWNNERKRLRNVEVPASPLPHYPLPQSSSFIARIASGKPWGRSTPATRTRPASVASWNSEPMPSCVQ